MEANAKNDAEFVTLLTGVQSTLALFIRGLMPDVQHSEEIVQEANARIWAKRSDFELGTNFKAWALTIARFEVLAYRKKQARNSRVKFSEELENTIAEEIEELSDDLASRHEALADCLKTLAPKSRELLEVRYGTSEKLDDFAKRVGRSLGGVKVALTRIRSQLAVCIERRLET